MYLSGDLHTHTTASDGNLSPKQLVLKAQVCNVGILAITDHDTTEGIDEAKLIASQLHIKIIPGIELSTVHNKENIHILGYFRDDSYKDSAFQAFLYEMKNYRSIRAKKIIDNLDRIFNIKLDFNDVYKKAEGIIARPHIAKAIIDAGYAYGWSDIFDKFLSNDSPAYVPNKKISTPDGIQLLKSKNALVVLAHPVLIKNSSWEELMDFDFDGIEAIYSQNSSEQTENLLRLAKIKNKLITAGSDFHGIGSSDTKHGELGSVRLSNKHLKEFINALKK
jgi:3',5'-nucleoside bisphosphate phosphatase